MLETLLIIIICIFFAVPIFTNTIGPIIVWRTQKLPANVTFQPIDNQDFIEERSLEFLLYDDAIQELDFELIGSSLLQSPETDSYFRLYWNGELKVAAMTVTIKSKVEEVTYIEFTQTYSDGSILDVSNSPQPEAYPTLDFKQAYRFPDIFIANDLLAAHTALKNHLKGNAHPVDFDPAKGFEEVEKFLRRESDALLQKGIVKPDIDQEGNRSLTLLGALALTYRSIPPGKNLWVYLTERRARKALKTASAEGR